MLMNQKDTTEPLETTESRSKNAKLSSTRKILLLVVLIAGLILFARILYTRHDKTIQVSNTVDERNLKERKKLHRINFNPMRKKKKKTKMTYEKAFNKVVKYYVKRARNRMIGVCRIYGTSCGHTDFWQNCLAGLCVHQKSTCASNAFETGMNIASMIPYAGSAASASKVAGKAPKLVRILKTSKNLQKIRKMYKMVKQANQLVDVTSVMEGFKKELGVEDLGVEEDIGKNVENDRLYEELMNVISITSVEKWEQHTSLLVDVGLTAVNIADPTGISSFFTEGRHQLNIPNCTEVKSNDKTHQKITDLLHYLNENYEHSATEEGSYSEEDENLRW